MYGHSSTLNRVDGSGLRTTRSVFKSAITTLHAESNEEIHKVLEEERSLVDSGIMEDICSGNDENSQNSDEESSTEVAVLTKKIKELQ